MNHSVLRPLLCAVTHETGQGGIARVSSLLWRVIQDNYPNSSDLVVAASPGRDLGWADKAKFCGAVTFRQMSRKCDMVFFDHLALARVQGLVPHARRRPYGVFLHSIEAWTPLSPGRLAALANAKLRVANSYHTAARVAAAHSEVGEIEVCHLALEPKTAFGDDAAVDLALLDRVKPNSVMIVGRMVKSEQYKGHDQLIEAWPLVKKQIGGAQLVIVGRGDDVPRLQARVADLALEESVLFTGRVSEGTLKALYNRAAVFAMPSRAEGFGLVYLEAMLHRLPCIGSIHDAAGEVIVDGETGFLVDQKDIVDLAGKIVSLLGDPRSRARLGCNGWERLQRKFSFAQFYRRMADLLDKLAT